VSPLRKADGAIEIDNTNLTMPEQLEKAMKLVKKII
jgi:cytidylate kinase